MDRIHYEAIIIGFGKGGKTLAARLGSEGKRVALIEKDPDMYGGTCINVGCIPTKSLIHSAANVCHTDGADRAEAYRLAVEEMQRLTSDLRQKNYQKLAAYDSVTIYDGTAHFTGPLEVEVATGEEHILLTGEKIFINTGSVSRIPSIEGIQTTQGVYTSAELMKVSVLPRHLVIIGGGYIGLEFASMYREFGSQVTVLQDSEVFLPREDEDIAAQIKAIMTAKGVEFKLGAAIQCIENGPAVTFQWQGLEQRIEADAILVATGRIPNIQELNCEAAGIELTERGAVKVDEYLRTTAPGIWAMGDVTGGLQHTYVSLDDFRVVWDQLSGSSFYTTNNRKNVPYSVFLSTPYSRVGLNEREAKDAGYRTKILSLPAAAIPKAQVLKKTEGMLKAIVDEETGKILGAMLLCEESYEMINLIKLAMDCDVDYTVLRNRMYTHPTMTEAFNDLF